MANATMKQLLVKLGVDSSDYTAAVRTIRTQLKSLNDEATVQHQAKVKQASKEVQLEKDKAAALAETVSHINRQLAGYKTVLAQQTLSEEKAKQSLATAKNLMAEQSHYLTILKAMPQAHDLDIAKLQKKLTISREEFALQESKMRLAAGARVQVPTGQPQNQAVTAGRVAQLEGQLYSQQARGSLAATEAEIAANGRMYKTGELQLAEYVTKQTELLELAHHKKLGLIENETLAQTAQVRKLQELGKLTAEEAELEIKVITEKNRIIAASESRRFNAQLSQVRASKGNIAPGSVADSQLTRQLARETNATQQAQVQAEMLANRAALAQGTLDEEAYVTKQIALQGQLHRLRMEEINAEKLAIESQIKLEVELGRISAEQAKLRAEIAVQQAHRRMVAEEQANRAAVGGIQGSVGSSVERIEGGASPALGLLGALTGGGTLVAFAGAMAAGELFYKVLEKIAEKVHEIFTGTGRETQLGEQFEKLAKRQGEDPEELLKRYRQATQGLVSDVKLYDAANRVMQSGMKITADQQVRLLELTTALSRSQGQAAETGLARFSRAMVTGRTQMLGFALGINRQELTLRGLPPTLDATTRATLETTHTLEVLERRFKEVGQPALTFQETLKRVEVAQLNFAGDVAKGLSRSQAFQGFIAGVGNVLQSWSGDLSTVGEKIGSAIGEMFVAVKPTLEALRLLVKTVAEGFVGLGHSVAEFVDESSGAQRQATTMHTFMGGLAIAIATATQAMEQLVNAYKLFWDLLDSKKDKTLFGVHDKAASDERAADIRSSQEDLAKQQGHLTKAHEHLALPGLTDAQRQKTLDYISQLQGRVDYLKQHIAQLEAVEKSEGKTAAEIYDEHNTRMNEINAKWDSYVTKIEQGITSKDKSTVPTPAAGKKLPTEDMIQFKLQQAKLDLQITKATEKEKLDIKEAAIKKERQLLDDSYQTGLIGIQTYVVEERSLAKREFEAKIQDINNVAKAQKKELELERSAKLQALDTARKDPNAKPEDLEGRQKDYDKYSQEYVKRAKIIDIQARDSRTKAAEELNQKVYAVDRKLETDNKAAHEKYLNELKALDKSLIDYRKQLNQEDLKNGSVTADDYLAKQRQIIQDEFALSTAVALQRHDFAVKNNQSTAEADVALYQARVTREKELSELTRKEESTRLEYLLSRYNSSKGLLESMAKIAATPLGRQASGISQEDVNAAQQEITVQHMSQMQAELGRLNPAASDYWENWVKIKTAIYNAAEEQNRLNEELRKSKDLLTPIASLFSSLASSLGQFSKSLGDALSHSASSLESFTRYRTQATNQGYTGTVLQNVGSTFHSLFNRSPEGGVQKAQDAATTMNALVKRVGDSVGSTFSASTVVVDSFTAAVKSAIQAMQAWASALEDHTDKSDNEDKAPDINPASPHPDLPQGTPSTVTLAQSNGGTLGNLFKKLSDTGTGFQDKLSAFTAAIGQAVNAVTSFISSFPGVKNNAPQADRKINTTGAGLAGAAGGGLQGASLGMQLGGPIGAAIGAAAGSVMGFITGQKNAQMMQQVNVINNSLSAIQRAVQDGNIHLGQAIQETQALRATAAATLGNSKKAQKSGEYASVMTALNQQLQQLQQQQKQTNDQMNLMVDNLSNPVPFQQYAQQLEGIVQQYTTFAQAATNAAQSAQALQFLNLSMQQALVQYQQQQLSNQVSAIQNAIQLNDLTYQRTLAERDYTEQVYDTLNAGVLSRQRDQAQTTASKLADMQTQYEMQMETMDEQIAVDQNSYNMQKAIFGLAVTRIDLENQLLLAQNAQTGYSVAQIEALQQLIDGLTQNAGSSALGTLAGLFNTLGLAQPISLTGYGQANVSQNRYGPTTVSQGGQQWIFQEEDGGFDLYAPANNTGDKNAWKAMGPDGTLIALSQADIQPGSFQAGGNPITGLPALVGEAGPELAVPQAPTTILPNSVVRALQRILPVDSSLSTTGLLDAHSKNKLGVEQQIHSMVMTRISAEADLLNAQQTYASIDNARLATLRGLLSDLRNVNGGSLTAPDIEQLLNNLYQTRGRYGSGGFYGQQL